MVRVVRLLLLAYVCVLGFLYFAQTWLIFPGRWWQGSESAQVEVPAGAELLRFDTASGVRVVALFGPALERLGKPMADASSRPTMLFFYGNGDCLAQTVDLFEQFRRKGVNVAVADYAGYGMSEGSPSESGCRETALALYDHVASRSDVDASRLFVVGWSLGSGVAIDLATLRPVAGIAAISPFTSLVDMARRTYPFVPASWLVSHRFDSEVKLRTLHCPLFLAHGRRDGTIPFDMSERLAAVAAGPVTFYAIDDARHNDVFSVGGPGLLEALGAFLEQKV